MKTIFAAVALATALIATPAFAQSSDLLVATGAQSAFGQVHSGAPAAAQQRGARTSPYNAYNAVTPFGSPGQTTNAARESALRACSTLAGQFKENTWGSMATQQYRSCMAQHGQVE